MTDAVALGAGHRRQSVGHGAVTPPFGGGGNDFGEDVDGELERHFRLIDERAHGVVVQLERVHARVVELLELRDALHAAELEESDAAAVGGQREQPPDDALNDLST